MSVSNTKVINYHTSHNSPSVFASRYLSLFTSNVTGGLLHYPMKKDTCYSMNRHAGVLDIRNCIMDTIVIDGASPGVLNRKETAPEGAIQKNGVGVVASAPRDIVPQSERLTNWASLQEAHYRMASLDYLRASKDRADSLIQRHRTSRKQGMWLCIFFTLCIEIRRRDVLIRHLENLAETMETRAMLYGDGHFHAGETCPVCEGRGEIEEVYAGDNWRFVSCESCDGEGHMTTSSAHILADHLYVEANHIIKHRVAPLRFGTAKAVH